MNASTKLTVNLVTWNGAKYIPHLFESLKKQSYKNWQLNVFDNDSEDEAAEMIREHLEDFPVERKIIYNISNDGFAGGHNQLFKETDSDYVLLLNQDMYLPTDCLENLVYFLEKNKQAAAVTPRLMRWDFSKLEAGGSLSDSFTNQVDAFGIKAFRNRRVVEWLTGRDWSAQQQLKDKESVEVFGVSGALPMYRTAALRAVAFSDGSFFDQSYQSYKEDVDLAYRLRSAGYRAYVLSGTVAYHDRSSAGPQTMTDRAAASNKQNQPQWVRYHSYKNHLATIYKNEYWQNLSLDFIFILWYELKKFFWLLLFDRAVLKGLAEIWKNRKDLKQKRAYIKNQRKVNWRTLRRWWT